MVAHTLYLLQTYISGTVQEYQFYVHVLLVLLYVGVLVVGDRTRACDRHSQRLSLLYLTVSTLRLQPNQVGIDAIDL